MYGCFITLGTQIFNILLLFPLVPAGYSPNSHNILVFAWALTLGIILTAGIGILWIVLALGKEKRHYGFLLVVMAMLVLQIALMLMQGSQEVLFEASVERVLFVLETLMIIAGVMFIRVLMNTRFIAKHLDMLLILILPLYCLGIGIIFTPLAQFWIKQVIPLVNVCLIALFLIIWTVAWKENAIVLRLPRLKLIAVMGFILLVPGAAMLRALVRVSAGELEAQFCVQMLIAADCVLFFLALLWQIQEQYTRLKTVALERNNVEQEAIAEHRRNDALRRANTEILSQQELLAQQRQQIEGMNTALQENNRQLGEQNIQLKELHKEKDEFLGIVAHDLKNPLAGIASFANILKYDDGSLTKEQRIEFVGHIIESAERMFDIIRNLLEINMLERGGMRVYLQPIEISSMLDYAVGSYEERAAQKRITLKKEFTVPAIALADERLIMQVIDNLISNAVKYSPHETNVCIRINAESGMVRLAICDQGPGLTEEDQTKLFGKFARLSAQPTGGEHSTGLGLSIVKKMVDAMNGNVWCESVSGQGATFIVELPEARAEAGL